MDTRRSYYLHSKQDNFAEQAADASRLDLDDIPFIVPANDNLRTKDSLPARCGSLLRRLIALHKPRLAAIARLKQDLRNGHGDDESPTAA
jgi:hypothetical protein